MDLYDFTIPMYVRLLRNIERWLDKGQAYAKQKQFDAEYLLQARLAPDQFPLVQQIQAACDSAKYATSKLAGKESPSHPDTEKTIEEIRARIRNVVAYLESFRREDFAGAEQRAVAHRWMEGKHMRGGLYVTEFATENFLFHVTTAYAILRHNGVELGKMDFIGEISLQS